MKLNSILLMAGLVAQAFGAALPANYAADAAVASRHTKPIVANKANAAHRSRGPTPKPRTTPLGPATVTSTPKPTAISSQNPKPGSSQTPKPSQTSKACRRRKPKSPSPKARTLPKRSAANMSGLEKRGDKVIIYKGIDIVKAKLDAKKLDYALIGGIAMQLHGMLNRITDDFDMVVDASGKAIQDALKDDKE
ncbi:hypothetical protein K461DRAFT_162688 [Myriangium duriaei CBS 260.36]|uniref:Uncharacterized protein n=1 Tax=Myriangium duriaei CBS 260.36 TaxID=1168546 RepID=A0A9P4IYX0_9PEZI|nr:hypothetical protein K461DRAFT_162688 [Myriangium duriaei CBS 260.36]